jgi:hypothetical protein
MRFVAKNKNTFEEVVLLTMPRLIRELLESIMTVIMNVTGTIENLHFIRMPGWRWSPDQPKNL